MSNSYHNSQVNNSKPSQHGEKGYPWLFFHPRRSWYTGLTITLIVTGVCGAFYNWYIHSGNDTFPGGTVGLIYAAIGTVFFILAAILYTLRRRSRKRAIGELNAALSWHVFFAIMALLVLFMHALGNFELISGTYALFGMFVLAISGIVGRMLDQLVPRLIAREVDKVLTSRGEDRIETVSQKLQAIVIYNSQQAHNNRADQPNLPATVIASHKLMRKALPRTANEQAIGIPWDLAYTSLEPTQQELDRDAPHYRLIPDKRSSLARPEALMPGAEEHISDLQDIHVAMLREQFYRRIIRYWRILHILLSFITVGLVIWHIIFALTLLLPGLIP
jgi:hypothetical protein